ncbi:MAG TPA: protein kinase [Planctomycetaceae bacterium]|nr:protein kinase [Planctomycetaceae bacterium]
MADEHNLLFGTLALQCELIDSDQFAEACRALAMSKVGSLAALLLDRGWIGADDRAHLDYLVQRKLGRPSDDMRVSVSYPPKERGSISTDAAGFHSTINEAPPSPNPLSIDSNVRTRRRLSDRFELSRMHASGGIGEIWIARDADLNRDVAIKRLQPGKSDSALNRTRFVREARITGQLEHPGVVPLYELCIDDAGQPYYAMRFLNGRTLLEAIGNYHDRRRSGEVASREFLSLINAFVVVCKTVAYAHSKGVVHPRSEKREYPPRRVRRGRHCRLGSC